MMQKAKAKKFASISANGASTEMPPAEHSFAQEAIQARIIIRLAEELKLKPSDIDIHTPFTSHGLDSLKAFVLTGELADWLGHALPATLFWNYPTVESLSRHLAEKSINWRAATAAPHDFSALLEEVESLSDGDIQQELAEIRIHRRPSRN